MAAMKRLLEMETTVTLFDGEVIGIDTDGYLILWDGDNNAAYNSGDTLNDCTLTERERTRLQAAGML